MGQQGRRGGLQHPITVLLGGELWFISFLPCSSIPPSFVLFEICFSLLSFFLLLVHCFIACCVVVACCVVSCVVFLQYISTSSVGYYKAKGKLFI